MLMGAIVVKTITPMSQILFPVVMTVTLLTISILKMNVILTAQMALISLLLIWSPVWPVFSNVLHAL